MAYKVIILYRLYMPSYFLGTFTEYPILLSFPHVRKAIRPNLHKALSIRQFPIYIFTCTPYDKDTDLIQYKHRESNHQ